LNSCFEEAALLPGDIVCVWFVMNSLVGLGAGASFAVSCVAAALPALRWQTFFEEPAMLLGGLE
jgi:hypothetical protein